MVILLTLTHPLVYAAMKCSCSFHKVTRLGYIMKGRSCAQVIPGQSREIASGVLLSPTLLLSTFQHQWWATAEAD